ncbi:MAG: PTS sugar transporter subunit IIA [Cetobacterium sp.]
MFKIIVSGHGEFASAIEKTLEYIIGKQENVEYINFNNGMGTKELEEKYIEAISKNRDSETLFLTDLAGGTPFSTAVTLSQNIENIYVLGGINIPTILAALEYRDEESLENAVNNIINHGKESLVTFQKQELNSDIDGDEGI